MFKKKKFERDENDRALAEAQEARRRDALERFPWLANIDDNSFGVTRDGFGLGLRNGLVQLPKEPPVPEESKPSESLEVSPPDPLPVLPGSPPPGLSPPYPPSLHPHLSSPPDPPGELKLEESLEDKETEERQEVTGSTETREALKVKPIKKDTKQGKNEGKHKAQHQTPSPKVKPGTDKKRGKPLPASQDVVQTPDKDGPGTAEKTADLKEGPSPEDRAETQTSEDI